MYVVAGATGHTGKATAGTLLGRKQPVRVMVRDEAKAAPWRVRGAEAAIASLDDAEALTRALAGAAGAYLLIPPRYTEPDLFAAQRPIADAIALAVKQSGIPHVVFLSSLGAQHVEGTGPIRLLHSVEEALGQAAKNLTVLRASYFLENWAAVLGAVQANGVLPTFLTPGRPVPMNGSQDVGRAAAEALLDPAKGTRIIELSGPADWTPEDLARVLGDVLGRAVTAQGLPLDAVVPAFTAAGFSKNSAELVREMYDALNRGLVVFEGGGAVRRRGTLGPREVLGPLLAKAPA